MTHTKVILNQFGYYQLKEIPSQEELDNYYANKYYQTNASLYLHSYTSDELAYTNNKIEQKAIIINDLIKPINTVPTLLDIGCGEGFTLNYFHKKGWQVKGIDFSDYGCKQHNPKMLPFFQVGDIYKTLQEITANNTKYDCIWLDNVLEHVRNPQELLINLKNIAHDGTVLVIEVPNDFSVLQNKLFEQGIINQQFWIAIPDHISYFNLNGLESLLLSCGWSVKDSMADFPIDFNLANPNANYNTDKTAGAGAHKQRLYIDSLMHSISTELTIDYYRVLAKMGLGRQIISFITLQ